MNPDRCIGFTGGDFTMGRGENSNFNMKKAQCCNQVYLQHAPLQQWGEL